MCQYLFKIRNRYFLQRTYKEDMYKVVTELNKIILCDFICNSISNYEDIYTCKLLPKIYFLINNLLVSYGVNTNGWIFDCY